jgi:hypothetical protein
MDLLKSRLRTAALSRTLLIDSLLFTEPQFPALYGTRTMHYRTNKITPLASDFSHKNAVYTLPKLRVLKIHFNIIFQPILRSPSWSSLQFCQLKYYMSSTLMLRAISATCSAHLTPFVRSAKDILRNVQIENFRYKNVEVSLHQNTGKLQKKV